MVHRSHVIWPMNLRRVPSVGSWSSGWLLPFLALKQLTREKNSCFPWKDTGETRMRASKPGTVGIRGEEADSNVGQFGRRPIITLCRSFLGALTPRWDQGTALSSLQPPQLNQMIILLRPRRTQFLFETRVCTLYCITWLQLCLDLSLATNTQRIAVFGRRPYEYSPLLGNTARECKQRFIWGSLFGTIIPLLYSRIFLVSFFIPDFKEPFRSVIGKLRGSNVLCSLVCLLLGQGHSTHGK